MAKRPGESSDRMFLVVVVEFSERTAGRAVEALHAHEVTAIRLPHVSHLRLAIDRMRPRVFLVDAERPGDPELEAIRTMRKKDRLRSVIVMLVGSVAAEALADELRELVDAYVRKPVDWKKVARAVVLLANNRPPPPEVVMLRTP